MAEQWEIDYDRKQYALMADHMRLYEEGRIDLGRLIAGLDALLQCLEAAGEAWKNEFRKKWGILEEVYAVALDQVEQGASPNVETLIKEPDNQGLIKETIENIKRLLADLTGAESEK